MSSDTNLWPDHTDRRATRYLDLFSVAELTPVAETLLKDSSTVSGTIPLSRAIVHALQLNGQPCNRIFSLCAAVPRLRGKTLEYLSSESHRWTYSRKVQIWMERSETKVPQLMCEDLSHRSLEGLFVLVGNYWEKESSWCPAPKTIQDISNHLLHCRD